MHPPFLRLAYVYTGTQHYNRDFAYYLNTLHARLVWEFSRFGARVCAFDLTGSKPFILLADHFREPGFRLMYEVENLNDTMKGLCHEGWKSEGPVFPLPDGTCCIFRDPSGNRYGLIQPEAGIDPPHVS
jgi:predicted enzyme related to lactoylglutathione lyase